MYQDTTTNQYQGSFTNSRVWSLIVCCLVFLAAQEAGPDAGLGTPACAGGDKLQHGFLWAHRHTRDCTCNHVCNMFFIYPHMIAYVYFIYLYTVCLCVQHWHVIFVRSAMWCDIISVTWRNGIYVVCPMHACMIYFNPLCRTFKMHFCMDGVQCQSNVGMYLYTYL